MFVYKLDRIIIFCPTILLSLDTNFVSVSYIIMFCNSLVTKLIVIAKRFYSGTYCTQCAELLIAFCNGNSTQNSSVEKQYGIQKRTNLFWLIFAMFSEKFALIGHQLCLSLLYVSQQFGYKINSRAFLSGTYCTQCAELLIAFCNGNSTQNSSVEKQYGIQKRTNLFWLIFAMFSEKFALIGHQLCLSLLYVSQQFGYKINSRALLSGTYCTSYRELLIDFSNGNSTSTQN